MGLRLPSWTDGEWVTIASLLNDPVACMKTSTSWLLVNFAFLGGSALLPVGCGSSDSHPGAVAGASDGGESGGGSSGDSGNLGGAGTNAETSGGQSAAGAPL